MRVGGVEVKPCEAVLVLPRPDGVDIPFIAKAVSIADEFNALVPMPTAPMVQTKDGSSPDLKDESYLAALKKRDDQRLAFLVLKSLEPSNIEWDGVDLEKPGTWLKWSEEMEENGISNVEVNRIIDLVFEANALDEAKIEAARKAFLLGQVA